MPAKKKKRFELLLWMFAPASITFLLFILYTVPKHIWGLNYVTPLLPLIPIFYWGRLQTSGMPFWFVFLIGLLMDVVSGTPLGLSALLYLLLLTVWRSKSKDINNSGFIAIWTYFMLSLAIFFVIQLAVMSFSATLLHTAPYVFIQWLLTSSFYPLFHNLFDRISDHAKHRNRMIFHG